MQQGKTHLAIPGTQDAIFKKNKPVSLWNGSECIYSKKKRKKNFKGYGLYQETTFFQSTAQP